MDRARGVLRQLRALTSREQTERELEDELSFHLELETACNVRSGMSPAAARRAAMLAFNGVERTREEVRSARWVSVIDDAVRDGRYAARSLRRTPLPVLLAVLTLALGIGANSALFGLVNGMLFRPPTAVPASERLVWVDANPVRTVSYPEYADVRSVTGDALDLAAYTSTGVGVRAAGMDTPQWVTGQLVSANFFAVLNVRQFAGRTFVAGEDRVGTQGAMAVISRRLWQQFYGADRPAIGTTLRVNGQPFEVVGVAPAGFVGLDAESPADLWVPTSAQPLVMPRRADVLTDRDYSVFAMVGRLRPGVEVAQAQATLAAVAERVSVLDPARHRALGFDAVPLRGWLRSGGGGSLLPAYWIITGLILLIACANVANLLLARGLARTHEIGIRIALGAGRWRLARLLIMEALLLSGAAGVVALPLALFAGAAFQARFRGSAVPVEVTPDAAMLLFSMAIAALSALLFGLVPALRASRGQVATTIRGQDVTGLGRTRLQRALVVAQVALSVVLLTAGALFLRRLDTVLRVPLGFDGERVLAVSFDLAARGLTPERTRAFERELAGRLSQIRSVSAVAVPSLPPFNRGASKPSIRLPTDAPDAERRVALGIGAAPGFFETLGIELVRGRGIQQSDVERDQRVAVLSESMARRLWPGEQALGRTFLMDRNEQPVTVIGVAKDVVWRDPSGAPPPQIYLPHTQHPGLPETNLLVRTDGDPTALVPAVLAAVRSMDPDLALFNVRTLADDVDRAYGGMRGLARVVAGLGALALVLASFGLYGLLAFAVAGRQREIGVRLALGARPARVVSAFVLEGLRLAAVGLAIGAVLAYAFARLLSSVMTGIQPMDAVAFGMVTAVLLSVSALASLLPALRAGRIDPMVALRTQ